MRRLSSIFFWLLLAPLSAAQFTTVTGTVLDPLGIPYGNGTVLPLLVFSGGTPMLNAVPYIPPLQATGLDSTGNFTVNIADNTQLSPGGSKWNFLVCSSAGTVQPSSGKGPVCFTLAAAITISGASQDISTQLQAVAVALTNFGNLTKQTFGPPLSTLGSQIALDNISPSQVQIADSLNSDQGALGVYFRPLNDKGTGRSAAVFGITSANTNQSGVSAGVEGLNVPTSTSGSTTVIGGVIGESASPLGTANLTQYGFFALRNQGGGTVTNTVGVGIDPMQGITGETNDIQLWIKAGISHSFTGTPGSWGIYQDAGGLSQPDFFGVAVQAKSLTCGIVGTTSCVITGAGSTSGTATLTWPAVAGTATNPIVLSNQISTPSQKNSNPCSASGTAANPSVVSCGASASGMIYCDVAASGGTCVVNTTVVTTASVIGIFPNTADGAALGKTCNAAPTVIPTQWLNAKSNGTSFTVNMPTETVNGECFEYVIYSN